MNGKAKTHTWRESLSCGCDQLLLLHTQRGERITQTAQEHPPDSPRVHGAYTRRAQRETLSQCYFSSPACHIRFSNVRWCCLIQKLDQWQEVPIWNPKLDYRSLIQTMGVTWFVDWAKVKTLNTCMSKSKAFIFWMGIGMGITHEEEERFPGRGLDAGRLSAEPGDTRAGWKHTTCFPRSQLLTRHLNGLTCPWSTQKAGSKFLGHRELTLLYLELHY